MYIEVIFHIKLYFSIINDFTHIYIWQQQKYIVHKILCIFFSDSINYKYFYFQAFG